MSTANARPGDFKEWRRKLMAKVHIGKKSMRLSDDDYRDFLEGITGKRSSADLDVNQLGKVIKVMEAKGVRFTFNKTPRKDRQNRATTPIVGKLKALWLSLYHLGVVRRPTDDALLAFVKRQTKGVSADGKGVQALAWLSAEHAHLAIEALKEMGKRQGRVQWGESKNPRICVLNAQARKLVTLGAWCDTAGLDRLAYQRFQRQSFKHLDETMMTYLIAQLGGEIREAQKDG